MPWRGCAAIPTLSSRSLVSLPQRDRKGSPPTLTKSTPDNPHFPLFLQGKDNDKSIFFFGRSRAAVHTHDDFLFLLKANFFFEKRHACVLQHHFQQKRKTVVTEKEATMAMGKKKEESGRPRTKGGDKRELMTIDAKQAAPCVGGPCRRCR